MGRAVLRLIICPVVATGLTLASFAVGPFSAVADDSSGNTTAQTPPTPGGTATDPSTTGTGDPTGTTDGGTGSTGSTGSTDPGGDPSTGTDPGTGTGTDPTPDPDLPPTGGTGDPGTGGTPPPTEPTAPVVTASVLRGANQALRTITLGYTSNQNDATVECKLTGPGRANAWVACPAQQQLTHLATGSYSYSVRGTALGGTVPGPISTLSWKMLGIWAPSHYSVPAGARFNNPYGSSAVKRRNLSHVINTINSMPGYRVRNQSACPGDPAQYPSTIRITLYSASDMAFARALVNASRRCISVQILMNGHLKPATTPSVRYLENQLGNRVFSSTGSGHRSFSHRCHAGCRGGGVLHSKMYLFDSALTAPGGVPIRNVVMVGSSNMTSNASGVQWNDLYTVKDRPNLHRQFVAVFDRMKRDHDERRTLYAADGIYSAVFTPMTPHSADPSMSALRSIHCVGATTGAAGHTVVYINMHAWFEMRGYALAHQVRSMSNHGCQVNILYSFMSRTVYDILRGAPRMSLRRTIFAKADGIHAKHYTHMKMIAADGYVGSRRGTKVVWTGSNNFTNDGTHFDEVTMRVESADAFNQYRAQFVYMRNTHSSPIYVKLLEPIGGGRAIDTNV